LILMPILPARLALLHYYAGLLRRYVRESDHYIGDLLDVAGYGGHVRLHRLRRQRHHRGLAYRRWRRTDDSAAMMLCEAATLLVALRALPWNDSIWDYPALATTMCDVLNDLSGQAYPIV